MQRLQPALRRLAESLTGNAATADEVVQETWAAVLRSLGTFEGRSSFRTWTLRICTHVALARLRHDERSPVPVGPAVDPERFDEHGAWRDPPSPWKEETPEAIVARREVMDCIWRAVVALPVRQRVAMVFQASALFDSISVGENIEYPLREHFPEMSEEERAKRVARVLGLVNLPGIEAMRPSDLSGGMRRRVGLARAIATDPEVILWDEPTTGLDPISTRTIDELIKSMRAKLRCTSIVVTHDMQSAFTVSDRIAMLANRKIVQVGTVSEMRASPVKEVRAFLDARKGEARMD